MPAFLGSGDSPDGDGGEGRIRKPYHIIDQQDQYGANEVGVIHPTNLSFLRIKDNGDIEISAGEGLAIILHPGKKMISFVADEIKFLTKTNGLKWNNVKFNSGATTFNEPTLIPVNYEEIYSPYRGTESFYPSTDTAS